MVQYVVFLLFCYHGGEEVKTFMGCAEGALRQRLRGLLIGMINLSR
jgi:hypothetical protein